MNLISSSVTGKPLRAGRSIFSTGFCVHELEEGPSQGPCKPTGDALASMFDVHHSSNA